jgi:hypothetical protein
MKAGIRVYLVGLLIATITGWSTYSAVFGQPPRAVNALKLAEEALADAEERLLEREEASERPPVDLPTFHETKSSRAENIAIERTIRTELKKLQGDVSADVKHSVQKALIKNVGLLFDLRQKQRVMELDAMEKELNRLRAVHERREAEKEKIVIDRVQQLVREKEGLGWGDDSRRRTSVDWAFVEESMPADFIEVQAVPGIAPVAPVAPVAIPPRR